MATAGPVEEVKRGSRRGQGAGALSTRTVSPRDGETPSPGVDEPPAGPDQNNRARAQASPGVGDAGSKDEPPASLSQNTEWQMWSESESDDSPSAPGSVISEGQGSGDPDSASASDVDSASASDGSNSPDVSSGGHTPEPGREGRPNKKNTRANVRIASENMKGRGAQRIGASEKWHRIAEDMRSQKIAFLALQETHLTDEHVSELEDLYGHLRIFNSALPANNTGAGGVAIVMNRMLTNCEQVETLTVIPGRALVCRVDAHHGRALSILAVYAPTVKKDNEEFWRKLRSCIKKKRNKGMRPDIVLGDFNQVEDAIDRFPARKAAIDAPDSFAALKRTLRVSDGWREAFPGRTEWTWRNADRTAMSRLDRIYLTRELLLASRNWTITLSNLTRNDHSRVSVDLAIGETPELGPGRWTMKPELMRNTAFMCDVDDMLRKAREEIMSFSVEARSDERNPQTVWKSFKDDVCTRARVITREQAGKRRNALKTAVREAETARSRLLGALTDDKVAEARRGLKEAEEKVQNMKDHDTEEMFAYRRLRVNLEAETMSKSWFGWTKLNRVREPIVAIRKAGSDPPSYITVSKSMAEIGKEYHEQVQNEGILGDDPGRADDIRRALDPVGRPGVGIDFSELARRTEKSDVVCSIENAKLGSAAGIDGIIYEFWKELAKREGRDRPGGGQWTDLSGTMAMVYRDVELHGVCGRTSFTEGWLCPLYKQGDRAEISNYRPITLLNTDYKIFTKSLATRLARIAPALIHPDQAGFVPGRSITDQTKLTAMVLSYAEATETNGMIVALDQEKAYDKIRHDYLESALREYGLPEQFISTIRTLYAHAKTAVMVNGFLSSKFRVTRGVRQGDPLSCLLFNIAIEPLPNMLRKSQLRGYEIEGLAEKLIATLYADDTTVYLSEEDDYGELLAILDTWCRASGARFNVMKTEIIPLGEPGFRDSLIQTRRLREDAAPIPAGVRIAKDGEVTRILGSWPGNGVGNVAAWSVILEKVQDSLDNWAKFRPTANGKSLISRAIIGGCTQYLTAAQGMPPEVEKRLDRMTLDFFWGRNKKHPINMDTLRKLPQDGGVNLFCAKERNDAQYLVWLGAFLSPKETRPKWAFVAEPVLRAAMIQKDAKRVPADSVTDPFQQSWRPNLRKLPLTLRRIMSVARAYGLIIDDPYIPERVREQMSLWAHPAMTSLARGRRAAHLLRCLKTNHAVRTIEDLDEIAEMDMPDHEDDRDCDCENCWDDRGEGCRYPAACQEMARDLLSQLPERWSMSAPGPPDDEGLKCRMEEPTADDIEDGETGTFDKDMRPDKQLWEMYRVFGNSIAIDPGAAGELMARKTGVTLLDGQPGDALHVTVCSAMEKDNTDGATGGYAVEFEDSIVDGIYGHLPAPGTTHTSAALDGIRAAAESAPPERIMHVVTNSRGAARALTIHLKRHEAQGWTDVPKIARAGRMAAAALRERPADTTITYVSKSRMAGWPEVKSAQWAARGAAYGCTDYGTENCHFAAFDRPGLQIVGITQKVAHRAIKQAKAGASATRRVTSENLARIQNAIRSENGAAPAETKIWEDLGREGLSRNARNFLWKSIHGAHKVGAYFEKMPEPWKSYGECSTCGVTETMEHILTECPDSGQETIWKLAREFLKKKRIDFQLNYGEILGCCSAGVGRNRAADRAFKIIVSESAFLAWKIRCTHRIENGDDATKRVSESETASRWEKVIGARMNQDLATAKYKRLKGRRPELWLIKSTWSDDTDYRNYMFCAGKLIGPGVLVSMESLRTSLGIG